MDDIKIKIEGAAGYGYSRCTFRTKRISPCCVLKEGTEGDDYSLTEPEVAYLVGEIQKLGFRVTNSLHGINIKW